MNNKLQEGISILYNMELNDYLMTSCINKLNYKINNLGYLNYSANEPQKPGTVSIDSDDRTYIVLACGILGVIIGVIQGFIEGENFFWKLFSAVVNFFVCGIIGVIVGEIIGFIYSFYKRSVRQKHAEHRYNEALKFYNEGLDKANKRRNLEIEEKEILKKQRDNLISRRNQARNKLGNFYSVMGIDENYRNLVPIGYMYEFMRLGISTKLTGVNGLYYLVRQELRGDQLQYSLDEISSKLDTIINNQYELYYGISDMNSKCDKLISQVTSSAEISAKNNQLLNSAVENTSLAAYNSQRIKEELKFQNFMYIYNS